MRAAIKRVIGGRAAKRLLRFRASAFEALGSDRYSWPGWQGLDRRIAEVIGAAERPGVFVEVGANDGYAQSNTYAIERFYGWKGLLIEPVPWLAESCRRFRPTSKVAGCALGERDHGDVLIRDRDLISAVDDGAANSLCVRVPLRSLSSVLDEAGFSDVDLLSLDVEGYELHVLRGLDLPRHAARFIVVETARPAAVAALLARYYSAPQRLSHHDYLFQRR